MKHLQRIFIALLLLILVIGTQKYVHIPHIQLAPAPTNAPSPIVNIPTGSVEGASTSKCHTDGILPDPFCTPGEVDPAVTEDNLFQTICVKGYTTTVRPPVGYTNALKIQQIQEYGYTNTDLRNYEEDHLISLELGGSPKDPKNLWPEPGGSPNPKDKIENLCHEKICSGQLTLLEAQRQIATNWPTACQ